MENEAVGAAVTGRPPTGRPISRSEWKRAFWISVGVMTLTLLPYIAGFARETAEWKFSGFVFGVQDGNSYIAKMQQGANGAWLFRLPYSSEPQRGVVVYEYFLLLGKLASGAGLHTQLVVIYHLARFAGGAALLLVCYRFLAEFLPEAPHRRLGLVLIAVGGGLGWFLLIAGKGNWFGSLPLDFYSPETFSLLTLYGLPHLAAARALMLGGLLMYLRAVESGRLRHAVFSGLLLLFLGFLQPLYVLVAYAVLAAHFLTLWLTRLRPRLFEVWRLSFVVCGLSSPIVLYTILSFSLDPLLKQWGKQNIILSPHPLHYLAAYGLLLIPAALGLRELWRRDSTRAAFLAGWAAVLPFLLYAPYNLNRRFAEGFQVALVTMAIAGLLLPGWSGAKRTIARAGLALLFGLTLPTTFLLLAGGIAATSKPAPPVFIPADEVSAFNWLADNAPPGSVVLSSFTTGNALPAYAPLVSYIGHGPETVFLSEKLPRVQAFFQSETSDAERLALLADGRIRFVLYGPDEKALGDFDPGTAVYLREVDAEGAYVVYEVVR